MIKYKKYKDNNYTFYYTKIKYDNKFTPYFEYKRNKMWNSIINHIIKIIDKENIKFKSGKPLKEIIQNNLSMWIANNLSYYNKLKDPFFPYNAKYNKSFIKLFVYLGNLSLKEAKVPAAVMGRVEKILVEEGDRVEKNQILALIDTKRHKWLADIASANVNAI